MYTYICIYTYRQIHRYIALAKVGCVRVGCVLGIFAHRWYRVSGYISLYHKRPSRPYVYTMAARPK